MSVFVWPPNCLPQSIDWWYDSPSRPAISPFDGDTTIISRTGDRWKGGCSFNPIFGEQRWELQAFLGRLRHQNNQFVMPPQFYQRRGTLVSVNLAPNNGRFETIGPWTGVSAAIEIDSNMLRITNSGATTGSAQSGAFTVVANTQYVFRVECLKGLTSGFSVRVGTSAGGSQIFTSGSLTQDGLYTTTFNSGANTTLHATLFCNTAVSGDFVYYDNLLIEPCALTQGAQSIGDLLTIDGLTASQSQMLRKSDLIEVNNQLLMLMTSLTTNASGVASVRVSPPTRAIIADNSPVIVGTPQGRFLMADEPAKWSTTGFFSSSFNLSIMEDLTT